MENNVEYCGMLMTSIFIMLNLRSLTLLSIYLGINLVFTHHWRPLKEILTVILACLLIIPLKTRLYLLCLIKYRMCWMSFWRYLLVLYWHLHVTTYLPQMTTRLKWDHKNKKFSITMFPNYYTYPSKHELISKLLCLISVPEYRILI